MQEATAKEPWLTVWLSSIYAGIGQIYCGNYKKGISFIVIEITLLLSVFAAGISFLLNASALKLTLCIGFGVSAAAFSIYNLFDAYKTAKDKNKELNLQIPLRKKQPFLALFLSSIVPGVGQIYNSQRLKGIGFVIGLGIIEGILEVSTIIGPLISRVFGITATLWIGWEAYSQAVKINGESSSLNQRFGRKNVLTVILLWLLIPVVFAGSLVIVIRNYFITPYKIPTGAMIPVLQPGDRIFSNKWIYKFEDPKRGDLIVFDYPLDPEKDFIKRVVGLPGEELKIEKGQIYVNGELIDTPQIPKERVYSNYEEWQYGKTGQSIKIPADSYFVLGDNSPNSSDSRNWGFVSRGSITGKASWIWWPPKRSKEIT